MNYPEGESYHGPKFNLEGCQWAVKSGRFNLHMLAQVRLSLF